MRLFWECLIVSKTLVGAKLKSCSFSGNWGLISIFRPISPKLKNPLKFNSPNLLMLDETILDQLDFGKNKPEVIPFRGSLGLISIFGPTGPKIKKCHKLRYYDLLGVLNDLLAFFYPEGKDCDQKPCSY